MKRLGRYLAVLLGRIYRPGLRRYLNPLFQRVRLVYLAALMLGLALAASFWSPDWFYQIQERVAWWPWSVQTHVDMALGLFEAGDEAGAKKELEKANHLSLLETKSVREKLKMAENKVQEPEKIREEIQSWEKILATRPFYRDVLLRLALLNYQIYEDKTAQDYWQQANYLDPNNQEVKAVGKIISPP
jgi:Tfp pilus assembly protein PilF